jgi:Piwi domain
VATIATATTLRLNGFRLEPSTESFTAYRSPMPADGDLRELRRATQATWTVYREDDEVLAVPRQDPPPIALGVAEEIRCVDHLSFLAYLIDAALPRAVPDYPAFKLRPFTFLGKKRSAEIVEAAVKSVGAGGGSPLVDCFHERPKYELAVRLVELRDGDPFIGLFIDVGTRREIEAGLDELGAAGVDLVGLDVVWREPPPDTRRLVGRIGRLVGDRVELPEVIDGPNEVPLDDVMLEGSSTAFKRCLRVLLGNKYESFEAARRAQQDLLLNGPARERLMEQMEGFLGKASPLELAPDLRCEIGERIMLANDSDYQTVLRARPVQYCFDSAKTKQHIYAWGGIERFGPFSRETFAKKSPRLLVVFPDTIQGNVESFLRAFRDGIHAGGREAFGNGFVRTFGLVNPEFVLAPIPWLKSGSRQPVADYRQTIEQALERDATFDAAFLVILDEHAQLPDANNPYLHGKALLLTNGIPSQNLRAGTLKQPPSALQYTMQNIAIALYAKMNGIPWTVDHDLTINDEIVIGLGTAELSGNRFETRQRYVGITTVFRGDGNYLLSNLSRECTYDEYADALRASTLQVLREIKDRNGWRPGDTVRIVCHSFKPLKKIELADIMSECVEELAGEQNVEFAFLTIGSDHPFAVSDLAEEGQQRRGRIKGAFAPERGTIVQVGRYSRLLTTTGRSLIKRADGPLPHPLHVRLHPQSTFRDLAYLTEQVLKFTSLSWRSTLPAPKPVTIYYSERIAELLARFRAVPDWSPAVLNTKLRASRWFL